MCPTPFVDTVACGELCCYFLSNETICAWGIIKQEKKQQKKNNTTHRLTLKEGPKAYL